MVVVVVVAPVVGDEERGVEEEQGRPEDLERQTSAKHDATSYAADSDDTGNCKIIIPLTRATALQYSSINSSPAPDSAILKISVPKGVLMLFHRHR